MEHILMIPSVIPLDAILPLLLPHQFVFNFCNLRIKIRLL